jgi:hypothetical protein
MLVRGAEVALGVFDSSLKVSMGNSADLSFD